MNLDDPEYEAQFKLCTKCGVMYTRHETCVQCRREVEERTMTAAEQKILWCAEHKDEIQQETRRIMTTGHTHVIRALVRWQLAVAEHAPVEVCNVLLRELDEATGVCP